MSTDGILARIDDELDLWEYGPDAARWRADVALAPERPVSRVQFGPPRVFIGDEEITVTAIEFDTVPAHAWISWDTAHMIRMVEDFGSALSSFNVTLTTVVEDAAGIMARLMGTFRLEPWPHGWAKPCFCHPAPFPAARDYRRRTKHRNRRRR